MLKAVLYGLGLSIILIFVVLCNTGCRTGTGQTEVNTTPQRSPTQIPASTPTRDPHELSREGITPLIRSQLTKTLEGIMPRNGWARLYRSLVEAKILDCSFDQIGMCYDCKAGTNGKNIRIGNDGQFVVPVGRKIPAVTGVSRIDSTSGVAQVSLTFQSASGYEHFSNLGDAFSGCVSRSGKETTRAVAACDTQNEQRTVHLRLYDDGWRIEKVD